MAKEPYVDKDRIYRRGITSEGGQIWLNTHLVGPDLLLVVSSQDRSQSRLTISRYFVYINLDLQTGKAFVDGILSLTELQLSVSLGLLVQMILPNKLGKARDIVSRPRILARQ